MFDLKRVAYSARGSYLLWDREGDHLVLKNAHGGGCRTAFRIPIPSDAQITFDPGELQVRTAQGMFTASLFGEDGTFLRGDIPVTLEYCEPENVYNANYVQREQDAVCIGDVVNNGWTRISVLRGALSADAPGNAGTPQRKYLHKCQHIRIGLLPKGGQFLAALEQFRGERFASVARDVDYEENVAAARADYRAWAAPLCGGDAQKEESAYILWSGIVPPHGNYSSETLLMSKAGMTRVWSWDNGFNALALAEAYPAMAMEQFLLPYRYMNAAGRVPDTVCEDRVEWAFVKPPVQGWIYRHMMEKNPRFGAADMLEAVYFPMKRNTDWWLNFRGEIPSYFHGNDSGCDNATCFDESEHVETPDLQAFLSIQCSFLSDVAAKLGLRHDRERYAALSQHFYRLATERYFDGELFVLDAETGQKYRSDALMPLRTIVLGNKLPKKMRLALLGSLRKFAGKYGFASEALGSGAYMKDGYWRGPVWAPDQILLVTALREMGESNLADRVASGYKEAIDRFGPGENSDPETGEPFRCKNYSWTACARLLL